ncbi:MAG: acylphosphatase [Armatimonadota bacterium]|nr:acylphosphatase [Armatimonadota bacterium]
MTRRFRAIIRGRVQGVGFRFFARQVANDLGIKGYVRNTPDGAVEVVAEGEDSALETFLSFLRQGPGRAHVTDVEVTWEEPTGRYDYFFVRG